MQRIFRVLETASRSNLNNVTLRLYPLPFSPIASSWCDEDRACTIRIDPFSIREMENEAVLAGIIGHEMGHVLLEHPPNPYLGGAEQFSADSVGIFLTERAGYNSLLFVSFTIRFARKNISRLDSTIRSLEGELARDSSLETLKNRVLDCMLEREEWLRRLGRLVVLKRETTFPPGGLNFFFTSERIFRRLGEEISRGR